MKPQCTSRTSRSLVLAVVLGACAVSACGLLLTPIASLRPYGRETVENQRKWNDASVRAMADDFGVMALFATIVYRPDLRGNGGCAYLESESGNDDFYGMPVSDEGKGRWLRWKGSNACVDDPARGLFYETYVFQPGNGKPEEAVIAFRGTENTRDQFVHDWRTNLAALFGIEPAQYELARKTLPAVISGLRSANPDIVIHAVGHSLGGGLAQQAGYMFPEIARVVTFNTSPVTNWTKLKFDGAVRDRYPLIYRIYHGGEILEKVRFVTTSLTSTRYNRYDLSLQFAQKSPVCGHSMDIIACGLAEVLADVPGAGDAGHHYGRTYIRQTVLGGLCVPKNDGCSAR